MWSSFDLSTSHVTSHVINPNAQLPTLAFPLWITDMITRLGQLPNWDVGSTSYLGNTPVQKLQNLNNWKTWWPDCDIRTSFTKMTSTSRDMKGKGWSKDWHICYLPETDNTSPEALSNLKCPFNTTPKPKDSIPAEFTENVWHLLSSQDTGAPYTGYYARLNNALVSVSNVYGVWFEVCVQENKFKCFWLAQNKLRLKNHPLPGINFILLEQTGAPTQLPSHAEGPSKPRETMPFAAAITATTEQVDVQQCSAATRLTKYSLKYYSS